MSNQHSLKIVAIYPTREGKNEEYCSLLLRDTNDTQEAGLNFFLGGGNITGFQSIKKTILSNFTDVDLDDTATFKHKSPTGKPCLNVDITLPEQAGRLCINEITQSEYDALEEKEQASYNPKQANIEGELNNFFTQEGEQIYKAVTIAATQSVVRLAGVSQPVESASNVSAATKI